MKIAINALGAHGGGIIRVLDDLSRALAAEHEVAIYLAPVGVQFDNRVKILSRQGGSRLRSVARSLFGPLWSRRIRADVRVDIAPGFAAVVKAPQRILVIHDLAFLRGELGYIALWQRIYRYIVSSCALKRADRIITVSGTAADECLSFRPRHQDKVSVLPLPVADIFLEQEPKAADLVSGAKIFVLAFAHAHNKGITSLIDLLDLREDLHLKLISPSQFWRGSDYEARLADPRYEGRFEVLSGISDEELARQYKASDVFCMPSEYEGYGLPVAEALACGVPTVVSDIKVLDDTARGFAIRMQGKGPDALGRAINTALEKEPQHWNEASRTLGAWTWEDWVASLALDQQPVPESRSRLWRRGEPTRGEGVET